MLSFGFIFQLLQARERFNVGIRISNILKVYLQKKKYSGNTLRHVDIKSNMSIEIKTKKMSSMLLKLNIPITTLIPGILI